MKQVSMTMARSKQKVDSLPSHHMFITKLFHNVWTVHFTLHKQYIFSGFLVIQSHLYLSEIRRFTVADPCVITPCTNYSQLDAKHAGSMKIKIHSNPQPMTESSARAKALGNTYADCCREQMHWFYYSPIVFLFN